MGFKQKENRLNESVEDGSFLFVNRLFLIRKKYGR